LKKKIYVLAFTFFIIDFLSKQAIINFIDLGDKIPIINNFFYLTHVTNTGGAWSILSGYTMILIFIGALTVVYIDKNFIHEELTKKELISFALLIGGIIGNIFDRVVYQKVVDFLDFNIFGYSFPVFNFADICIVLGALIMIIQVIGGNKNGNHSRKTSEKVRRLFSRNN